MNDVRTSGEGTLIRIDSTSRCRDGREWPEQKQSSSEPGSLAGMPRDGVAQDKA
jgi:hypothetical protein